MPQPNIHSRAGGGKGGGGAGEGACEPVEYVDKCAGSDGGLRLSGREGAAANAGGVWQAAPSVIVSAP